jgi:hypothetical protein
MPPGPTKDLATAYIAQLSPALDTPLIGQLWTGQWPPLARASLGPVLARCTLTEARHTLLVLGRLATQHCLRAWSTFYALLSDLQPPLDPLPDYEPSGDTCILADINQLPTTTPTWHSPSDQIDWDPRLGEDYG